MDMNLLEAVSDVEFERSLDIATRAGVEARSAGAKLRALELNGYVVKKWTQKHGGVWLYRRSEMAPSSATRLVEVSPDHNRWCVEVGVQDGVESITAGTWTKSGPGELSHGISIYTPDAKALRSIISDLHQALTQIEGGAIAQKPKEKS